MNSKVELAKETAGGSIDSKPDIDKNTMKQPESSSEYDSDFDSEDEEEEEPRLKYERVRGDLSALLDRDSLTTIASDDKVVVLGTMGGGVVILDHLGYNIQHRRPHNAQVVSVALVGDYWASAGKDRKVVVTGLLSTEHNYAVSLDVGAVVCVLLDPRFGAGRSTTRFAVGHSNGLNLYERSLFGGYKCSTLSDSAGGSVGASIGLTGGAVRAAAWRGSLLAWATDTGVRIYHLGLKTTIALVQRDHSAALDSQQFPPQLRWHSDSMFLIGWADSVKICRIKPRPKEHTNSRSSSRTSSPQPQQNLNESVPCRTSSHSIQKGGEISRGHSTLSLTASQTVGSRPGSRQDSPNTDTATSPSSPVDYNAAGHVSSSILSSSIIGITGNYGHVTPPTPPPLDLPPLFVEIECMFNTPFYICGIGMLDDLIIALTYNKTPTLESSRSSPTDMTGPQHFTDDPFEWRRPQLRLLQPHQRSYEEMSKDVLGTNRYKDYLPLHYKLDCVKGGDRWYVLSPRDLVVARPREPIDSLEWLLQYHKFPQAMHLLENEGGTIGQHSETTVGRQYLNHLLECKNYPDAARLSRRVLADNVAWWQDLVKVFAAAGELPALYDHIPTGIPPLLPVHIYDLILMDLLDNDRQGLLLAVQKWPSECYGVNNLVSNVLQRVATQSWSVPLLQALAHLYSHQQCHEKALAIYIKLEHKDIFGLIKKHNLYSSISHYAVHLMSLDADLTTELCMKHVDDVPPSDMMPALTGHTKFLFKYLSALYEQHKEMCGDYHDDLVQLMADNQQSDKLLKFLKSSKKYNLTKALKVCKDQGLLHHTVYLLNHTGNTQDALSLVLLEARDLNWAISLCKDHNDTHLWDILIDNTIQYPENIRPLLQECGKYVGEERILQRIPAGLTVPGIMSNIATIMENINKKYALHSGCERLHKRDIVKLTRKRKDLAKRAMIVDDPSTCPNCSKKVSGREGKRGGGLVAFKCQHVFHMNCVSLASDTERRAALQGKRRNRVIPTYICVVCQLKDKLFG